MKSAIPIAGANVHGCLLLEAVIGYEATPALNLHETGTNHVESFAARRCGAGLLYDLVEVVRETGCSTVACSSIFAFTDNKPIKAKAFLEQHDIPVRPI